jgi:D-arginine dehydrogenase
MWRFIVIGGGIAGASAAFHLAGKGRTLLLERESQPGYHSTGRSAALYSQAYGNAPVRALTVGSEEFYKNPPPGFTDHPMLTPRGSMFVAAPGQEAHVEAHIAATRLLVPSVRMLDRAEALALCPVLRPDMVAAAGFEPEAEDIDVSALHQGYLRGLRARGGTVMTDAEVLGIDGGPDGWAVRLKDSVFAAPVLVNAAGAWADVVGEMAGAKPIGMTPCRRTAFLFAPPANMDVTKWPMVIDGEEQFYFKPDAGKLLGSLADETPDVPQDVQPDELDVAIAADRIMTATTLEIRRIEHRWAGLRSFVSDRTPVNGFDPDLPGFFWLAGQGGYGIQTAPGMGESAAALATGEDLPQHLRDLGLTAAMLSPARLR